MDWDEVAQRYKAGETAKDIAKDLPVTYAAVTSRLRRMVPLETDERAWGADVAALPDAPDWTFDVGVPAAILADIAGGMPESLAAAAHGVSRETVRLWKRSSPGFERLVRRARGLAARESLTKVKGSEDWRAQTWWLERNPDMREEGFAQDDDRKSGGIQVVINVSRDERIAIEGGVIDVTPTVIEEKK